MFECPHIEIDGMKAQQTGLVVSSVPRNPSKARQLMHHTRALVKLVSGARRKKRHEGAADRADRLFSARALKEMT